MEFVFLTNSFVYYVVKKRYKYTLKIIRLNIKLSSKIIIAHKYLFYNSILNKTKNMLQI